MEQLTYNFAGAARMLGLSIPNIKRLTRSGALKYRKIGRLVRFTVEDFNEFLDSVRRNGTVA